MARDTFINPATGATYVWPLNHEEEDASGKARNITRTAATGLVGMVKQQGEDGPFILHWSGKITRRAQFQAMWAWYALSRTQTIYLRDFDGQEYEVQITEFQVQRHRKLTAIGPDPSMPSHYWTYTITFEVYVFRTGDMTTAGVTP